MDRFDLPVQFNTSVQEVMPGEDDRGYEVKTVDKTYQAKNVVMATGSFQKPKIPAFSAGIPEDILQLHSGKYRNPGQLPDGAVLIIGSAQSGTQIAEELYQSGRTVYLSTCSVGRGPRRYRGRDVFSWLLETGFMDQTVDRLDSPKQRLAGNPHVSGRDGGHSINLHQFARDGVILLGHFAGVQDGKVILFPDLKENLVKADKFEQELAKIIDRYIETNGIEAPAETLPGLQDGYSIKDITELDLKNAGIHTVIWAMGYTSDYSLIRLPLTDEDGFPIQQRGITQYPGLYFIGTTWMHKRKSPLFLGVGEDAEYIVSHITR